MPTLSLDAIQQRIAKQNSELQALHRELETRQGRLRSLAQRKEELQAKLRQIEAEMAAIAAGTKRPQTASPKAAPKKLTPKPSAPAKSSPPSLISLLLAALRSAGRPLTAKQLVAEVKRRGFRSESTNFTKMVGSRLWDLKKQGIIRRATGQPGYSPAPVTNGVMGKTEPAKAAVQKATAKASTKSGRSKTAVKPVPKQLSGAKVPQVTLREVVTQVLKKMGVPLTASELTLEVLKAGYRTNSTKFVNNVYVILGRMDNVEHIEGQGYRLKRRKS